MFLTDHLGCISLENPWTVSLTSYQTLVIQLTSTCIWCVSYMIDIYIYVFSPLDSSLSWAGIYPLSSRVIQSFLSHLRKHGWIHAPLGSPEMGDTPTLAIYEIGNTRIKQTTGLKVTFFPSPSPMIYRFYHHFWSLKLILEYTLR